MMYLSLTALTPRLRFLWILQLLLQVLNLLLKDVSLVFSIGCLLLMGETQPVTHSLTFVYGKCV